MQTIQKITCLSEGLLSLRRRSMISTTWFKTVLLPLHGLHLPLMTCLIALWNSLKRASHSSIIFLHSCHQWHTTTHPTIVEDEQSKPTQENLTAKDTDPERKPTYLKPH